MSSRFEEIDRRQTPIGEISVRRRLEPTLQIDVYEIKLGDEFLMSSLFTVAEVELARLALTEVPGRDLDVVVGGLGLGYTARAVLEEGSGFGPLAASRCHAVLVDIDHTPRHVLHPSHAGFYTPSGLRCLVDYLHPGGVFALWSDGAPDSDFIAVLEEVFASCEAHVVTFANFYTGREAASTVYVAKVDNG